MIDAVQGQASVVVAQRVSGVTVTPASVTIAPGATQQFAASAKDANNNDVAVTFLWVSSNHNVAIIDQNGLATGVGGGTVSITAAGQGVPGSAGLTVSAAPGATLAFTVQPTNATAGEAINPAVEVEVRDESGARVKGARNTVTLALLSPTVSSARFGSATFLRASNKVSGSGAVALSSGPQPGGSITVNAVDGVASFSGLTIEKAAAGYTLTASSGSLKGATSNAFSITAAAAAQLAFMTQPSQTEGSEPVKPAVRLQIRDRFSNHVTAATNQVTIGLAANPSQSPISGTLTVAADAGVATFSNVRIDRPSSGYRLAAAADGLAGATSAAFTIRLTFTTVDANSTVCGLTAPKVAYCWGYGEDGQLGDGTTPEERPIPSLVQAPAGVTFGSISAGSSHSCAVTVAPTAGEVYCWGEGGSGQLGNGSTSSHALPVKVAAPAGVVFAQVSVATWGHTCAVASAPSGVVYCWGYGNEGQLGNNTTPQQQATPVPVTMPADVTFSQVSAGGNHTCALAAGTSGAAYCWGYNGYGQLGDSTGNNKLVPTKVKPPGAPGAVSFAQVDAGSYYHTCARTAAGVAYCWGNNDYGQLGDNTNTTRIGPTLVQGNFLFSAVSAGGYHTCAIQQGTNAGHCWGANWNGMLGEGTNTTRLTPFPVSGGHAFSVLRAGSSESCGLATGPNPGVYCWGYGGDGQIGDGLTLSRNVPTRALQ
jgi:alpha-tubulin suppressor-like RCC1 family protein